MTGALIYKEFRETLPIALVGLALLMLVALDAMEYSPLPDLLGGRFIGAIPFLGQDQFFGRFNMAAGALAIALGFWHSLGDFWGEAHLFLLHRPVSRQMVYVTKLVMGLIAYFVCAAVPVLVYAWWAATPGTHASPFEWPMTLPAWSAWFSAATVYLGAFLGGLRPGAWLGTRLAPLAAAGGMLGLIQIIVSASALVDHNTSVVLRPLLLILTDLGFISAILFIARQRDFS